MRAILPVIVIIALVLVSFALVVGISLGIGWVLTLVLPLSLFEGTVVSVIAAIVTLLVWRSVLAALSMEGPSEEVDDVWGAIPESRFWTRKSERTWENWFRYVLANAVYEEMVDSLDWAEDTSEREAQELSIHLVNVAVEGLKGRPSRTKQVRVSQGMLKHELSKLGDQAYPDEVLKVATGAINLELEDWKEEVQRVIRERLWEAPAEVD